VSQREKIARLEALLVRVLSRAGGPRAIRKPLEAVNAAMAAAPAPAPLPTEPPPFDDVDAVTIPPPPAIPVAPAPRPPVPPPPPAPPRAALRVEPDVAVEVEVERAPEAVGEAVLAVSTEEPVVESFESRERLVAAEPVAFELVGAEPIGAEPVAAEPIGAEPVAAEPVVAGGTAAVPVVAAVASEAVAAEPIAEVPPPEAVDESPVEVVAAVVEELDEPPVSSRRPVAPQPEEALAAMAFGDEESRPSRHTPPPESGPLPAEPEFDADVTGVREATPFVARSHELVPEATRAELAAHDAVADVVGEAQRFAPPTFAALLDASLAL
jgi:nicotinate-nucleotide--dimethylbenzimidazole phosphoribosyltransferase